MSSSFVTSEDLIDTDGEEDDRKMLELNGVQYPHKSWFFVFHSTISGKYTQSTYISYL